MATAFIPAKKGSSRLARKNFVDLGGQPLIAWTLEACARWSFIDKVVVATITNAAGVDIAADIADVPTVAEFNARTLLSGTGSAYFDFAADTVANVTLCATVTTLTNDAPIDEAAIFTTAMVESYAADGVAPTPAQALFLSMQRLTEFAIASTTITVKKLDGSTTAATLTLDDETSPTSSTRAT